MSARDGRLHREELAERLRHFTFATSISTSDLLSGGVVALAAGVGLEIVSSPHEQPMKLLFWAAGLLLFVILHAFWRLGALFASWGSGIGDLVLPLALGLVEFAGFIVLSHSFSLASWWVVWPFMAAGQTAAASAFVHNRLVQAAVPDQYADDCGGFIEGYVRWMRQGRGITAVLAAVLLTLALAALGAEALKHHGWSRGIGCGAAVLSLVAGCFSLAASSQSQRQFQRELFGGPAANA